MSFEPKTESKEFEIASLDQNATTGGRSAGEEAADLTIRVLRPDASRGAADLTWNSESVLVYMIADLVAASHGRTAIETPAAMAAHFDRSLQALVAAKRIQTAILEFLTCRPGDCTGAAVLIHPSVTTGFTPAMAQSALRLAEPGQIILSPQVARQFKDLPGIELRAVAALTTGGTEHAGLTELIWTSTERLASLRNSAPTAPLAANLAPPVGATMIVNAPLESALTDVGERAPGATDNLDTRGKQSAPADDAEEWLAEFGQRHSLLTPLRIAVGAAAIVIVIVGLILFHPWSGPNVRPKPQAREAAETPAPMIERPASNIPQPPPLAPPVADVHPKTKPPVKPPAVTKSAVFKTAKDVDQVQKPVDTPIQGFEGNSTYDGMTQRDIPRLLQWARSDAGNGNYAKAAQEYRVILQLQPNNPDAKEGLRKIQVAQGLNQ